MCYCPSHEQARSGQVCSLCFDDSVKTLYLSVVNWGGVAQGGEGVVRFGMLNVADILRQDCGGRGGQQHSISAAQSPPELREKERELNQANH